MKLAYRGANYDYDIPTVDMTEGEVAGKYRGQNWNYRYPRHIPMPQHPQDLQYRGVGYRSDRPSPKIEEDVAVDTAATMAIAAAPSYPKAEEVATVHRAHICNILDRRQQIARAKGDERLLRLLEKESRQMAC
ncbi:DUF4278 domain-containing protein [Microcoleus sp.]|uniref:DUF4278 domain-containing protein n=1 Tax=Microcoleus sp. TaxID=44472 RepID=UPI00352597CF